MNIKTSALAIAVPGFLALSGHATAACTGPALNQADLNAAVSGNTVCAVRSSERWQEFHQRGGSLIDYKRGPTSRTDPSQAVGSWSVTANPAGNSANIVYNYGTGGSFTYSVRGNGGASYSFCGVQSFDVTIRTGQGACP